MVSPRRWRSTERRWCLRRGDEGGGIDVVCAYGFSVIGSGGGVLTELHGLTSQVQAMEEKVRVHPRSHASLVEDDLHEHYETAGALSAVGAMASGMPRQVVPHMGDASRSALGAQQVAGCGAPPFGLRPHFVRLACFIGLLAFGIAGAAAAGLGGSGIDGIDNDMGDFN
ncbi:hypothetical protein CYMTET_38276 [Cymbomonas tetramitiformis]|uniref:Uncharacterized protein n=1 Tax=Cymbomonas tetramitiformis TaxID=36881 RepID=A0AAE0CDT6_9CHLO|nr:hypothetical protein CYMTET_38279 [Cymbomonas tetramitiformis]KAK3252424.1 hypothetical protein CYMTET_38276 [Cymbomonas tetramitiformis]